MSFWGRVVRWLDGVFGGGPESPASVDPSRVDAAIRLIQSAVEDEQRARQVRKLRVTDLDEERQASLARELAQLLKKPEEE
jgi:hypothetical protein